MKLDQYQIDAISKMRSGSILCGWTGSGKSITGLAYFYIAHGGDKSFLYGVGAPEYTSNVPDLIIITTAKKRDDCEWDKELRIFGLSRNQDLNAAHNNIIVDSWNNIKKYRTVCNAFFIFDEQRLVGKGVWVKSFLEISRHNKWILLSATPGDTWEDYMAVFIANGFYRNMTEFRKEHIVYSTHTNFPKIDRYINTSLLEKHRNEILVDMHYKAPTITHDIDIVTSFDRATYKQVFKDRWDPYENEPIENISKLCHLLQRIANSDESRKQAVLDIYSNKDKVIIFYNYDFELDILKSLPFRSRNGQIPEVAEWNGHKHEPIPETNDWIYLVQYSAGCEGWNCILTDTIIFYSQNYSYKIMKQAAGRIDRRNTGFKDLYYYHLKTTSSIDIAISKAIAQKRKFNETRFVTGK